MLDQQTTSRIRTINGVVSLTIMLAFIVHAVVNSLRLGGVDLVALGVLAWVGAALSLVHVLLCMATSAAMLGDTERPPSPKKRRHLLWKWLSGVALLVVAAVHVAQVAGLLPSAPITTRMTIAGLSILLGMHLWAGARSLLKDVGLPREWKPVFKGLVALLAAACAIIVLV